MASRLLVLSDGKPGHLNQSLALARLLGCDYEVARVGFPGRTHKVLSYLLGALSVYTARLFRVEPWPAGRCAAVVAAGSDTYYAALTVARQLRCPAIAVMLPRGYRYADFSRIFAQEHDAPPRRDNLAVIPVNLCAPQPQGVFTPRAGVRYAGVIIGGPNKVYDMPAQTLGAQLEAIARQLPGHELVVATSRRTPPDVEALLTADRFRQAWLYSRDPANPIPDFLFGCDYLFVTGDSTSMISEAVTAGHGRVEILPLPQRGSPGKHGRMVARLAALGCLHVFDGTLGDADRKIDLTASLGGVMPCA